MCVERRAWTTAVGYISHFIRLPPHLWDWSTYKLYFWEVASSLSLSAYLSYMCRYLLWSLSRDEPLPPSCSVSVLFSSLFYSLNVALKSHHRRPWPFEHTHSHKHTQPHTHTHSLTHARIHTHTHTHTRARARARARKEDEVEGKMEE